MALSPMMKFYLTLKEKYNDCIVFFRLGDFYEMFFDDAKIASELLDLTLTGRDCGLEERAPMCGIPYHAADGYIQKLVSNGLKVAICEQLSAPSASKGLVERDVIRVITPGTVIEDNILDDKRNNYIACTVADNKNYAIAWLDISTGEFCVAQQDYSCFESVEDRLISIAPAEIICNEFLYNESKNLSQLRLSRLPKFQNYYDWAFNFSNASNIILKQFQLLTLEKFELSDKKLAVCACGALLNYLSETQKRALIHLSGIKLIQNNKFMVLDSNTRRNLELCENTRDGGKKASLLWVLDKTRTSMGARNLRRWIENPLRDSKTINLRLASVEELVNNTKIRKNLFEELSNVKDMERLTSKLAYGNPSPRDFVALKYSLAVLPTIKNILQMCKSELLLGLDSHIHTLDNIKELLENSICDDCPVLTKDGGYIKNCFDNQLDQYRNAKNLGKQWLAQLEAKEKESTGIKNLKIGYNKVFGYYIELSKGNIEKAPFYYIRKQTLTTGERYITEELKVIEEKLMGSVEKALELESIIFDDIKNKLIEVIPQLQDIAKAISCCDCLVSLAVVAVNNNYCKPNINENIEQINITDGRHPVVEALNTSCDFVANDALLDSSQNRTMIITGPNMAGKSTYMRQVALITLLAHIGSFVSAKSADISLTDRIFTRIGASDDLAYGQSTFMVEMVEVATILQNATYKSLLILDEIGRGTSTFDGMAIARAVMEQVTNLRCKTLFSTHYHELTDLEGMIDGIKNYKILATEKDKGIIFLHKIMRGGTNKSFGIEVAKLAGIPNKVILRAKEISKMLESNPLSTLTNQQQELPTLLQMGGIKEQTNKFKQALQAIDIDNLTPMQAFGKLNELVVWAKEEK